MLFGNCCPCLVTNNIGPLLLGPWPPIQQGIPPPPEAPPSKAHIYSTQACVQGLPHLKGFPLHGVTSIQHISQEQPPGGQ